MIQKFCQSIVKKSHPEEINLFDKVCIFMIVLDAALIFAETFSGLIHLKPLFDTFIWIIVGFFAIEYFIRLIGSKNKKEFSVSFYGIVDLISFLPMILTLGGLGLSYVRVFRLIKFLKFTKYMKSSKDILDAMLEIRDQLVGFLMIISVFVYIFAISIFHFESMAQPEKMNSAMDALYLAMVTITTLGYGDITPITFMGRMLTIGFALISLLLLMVPTSLFLAEYQKKSNIKK